MNGCFLIRIGASISSADLGLFVLGKSVSCRSGMQNAASRVPAVAERSIGVSGSEKQVHTAKMQVDTVRRIRNRKNMERANTRSIDLFSKKIKV